MIYYVDKKGAILKNGAELKPGQIIDNYFQDIGNQEFHYTIADSLIDLKKGNCKKITSTKEEFYLLYNNEILRDIKELTPPDKCEFTEGQLVREKGTVNVGVIVRAVYDYERMIWQYPLYTVDTVTNVHSGKIHIGLYGDNNFYDEDELEIVAKGKTSIEINKERFVVNYEQI